jgi:hypothetical protein
MADGADERERGRFEPRRDRDEESDTYELNLDDEPAGSASPPPAAPKPRPASKPKPASPEPASDAEADAYELAEPEPAPSKSSAAPLRPELLPGGSDVGPGADADDEPPGLGKPRKPSHPSGVVTGGRTEAADRAAAEGKPIPKLYQSEPEPEYIDPAVAASRREQARIRAAEQMALEEEARRKRNLIIAMVLLLLAVLVGLYVWLFWM